jgi:hypothetical protein
MTMMTMTTMTMLCQSLPFSISFFIPRQGDGRTRRRLREAPHQDQGWHCRYTQWGMGSHKGASPRGPWGKELTPSQQEAGALNEAGQWPKRQRQEGVGELPLAPTAGDGSCDKVLTHPTSSHPDKEQQGLQLTTSTVTVEEGNVVDGGDVAEGVIVVVPEVEFDPPQTGSGEIERRGEKDTHVVTE